MELSNEADEAKKCRNEYFRKYREANREKIRKISSKNYYKKKLEKSVQEYIDYNKNYAVKKERITQAMSMCDSFREKFEQIQPNDIITITQVKRFSKKFPPITYTFEVKVKQKNKTCLFCHSDKGKITIQFSQILCGEIKIN